MTHNKEEQPGPGPGKVRGESEEEGEGEEEEDEGEEDGEEKEVPGCFLVLVFFSLFFALFLGCSFTSFFMWLPVYTLTDWLT